MSIANLDMASDEDYHSESEFYYPDEKENYNEKGKISSLHDENHQSAEFTRTTASGGKQDLGHSFFQYGPPVVKNTENNREKRIT